MGRPIISTLIPIENNCETYVDTVEEEVSSYLGNFVVAFRLKITDGQPLAAGNTVHQDGILGLTSPIRGCHPNQTVQSSLFASTEE